MPGNTARRPKTKTRSRYRWEEQGAAARFRCLRLIQYQSCSRQSRRWLRLPCRTVWLKSRRCFCAAIV